MEIPTEPIGSIPRPRVLIDALRQRGHSGMEDAHLEKLYDDAVSAAGIEIVHSAEIVRAEIDGKDAAVVTSDGRRHDIDAPS